MKDSIPKIKDEKIEENIAKKIEDKRSMLTNRMLCDWPLVNNFMTSLKNIAEEELLRLKLADTKSQNDVTYFYNQNNKAHETYQAFKVFFETVKSFEGEANLIFDIVENSFPIRGNETDDEYFSSLEKYDNAQCKKFISFAEKMNKAAEELSGELDRIQPHKKTREAQSFIIAGLIDLFEMLHEKWPVIPKVPSFLKTNSQKEAEKIKEETDKITRNVKKKR